MSSLLCPPEQESASIDGAINSFSGVCIGWSLSVKGGEGCRLIFLQALVQWSGESCKVGTKQSKDVAQV